MRLRPGDWVALGLVAEALAVDVWLIRHRHDTISTCVRTALALQILYAGVGLHLARSWRYDPLSRGGDWLRAQQIRRATLLAEGVIPVGTAG